VGSRQCSQQAVGSRQWVRIQGAANSGQQAVSSRQWAAYTRQHKWAAGSGLAESGQQTVGCRRWVADSRQQAVGSRQWQQAVGRGSGQLAVGIRRYVKSYQIRTRRGIANRHIFKYFMITSHSTALPPARHMRNLYSTCHL
jgi:hypothetical protein